MNPASRLRRLARGTLGALPSLAGALGAVLIGVGSVVYFVDEQPPFLVEKLPLARADLWLLAVRVHVVSAVIALPACLLLAWPLLVRRAPAAHRWLGRTTGVLVLGGAVPSGFYLAAFARGGLAGTLGFWLSGLITAVAMAEAIRRARSGEVARHRRAASHVLAQLSVAVTSRTMLFAMGLAGWDSDRAYLVSLWVPVVASALVVEAWRRPAFRYGEPRRDHETNRNPRRAVRRLADVGVAAR